MKQFIIIGMGKFGQSLTLELSEMGHEVMAVDKDEAALMPVQDHATHVMIADATEEDVIQSLGIENFDCAVVAIGNDIQSNILASINCKEQGIKAVWAKAHSRLHGKVLDKIGVDRVIYPEQEMGERVAHLLTNHNMLDYLSLAKEYQLIEVIANPAWVGHSIDEQNFRSRHGVTIIAIRSGEDFIVSPPPDYVMKSGDVLVVVGKTANVEKL